MTKSFRNPCLLLAVLCLSACNIDIWESLPDPPKACVPGTYRLLNRDAVRLQLSEDQFVLSVGSDHTSGTFEYDQDASLIIFTPTQEL